MNTAIAIHHVGEDEHGADDSFELIRAPSIDQHVCQVSGIESSIKVARISMKHKVHENSSKPVPQIYEEVRKDTLNT